LDFYLWQAQ